MQTLDPIGFTAHNVRLDDGTQTFPAAGATIDQLGNYHCVKNMLELVYPDGYAGKSIVDLGCLEGGFTSEFARLGLESTGIEVRESNLANARYLKAQLKLPNLHFHCDDAWNVGKYGPFDIVFCVGLYYHIEDAGRFLRTLADNCRKLLFLDTHFAPEEDDHPAVAGHGLSELTTHEGMIGRWYPEHDLDAAADEAQLQTMKWHSWANKRSFWPTKASVVDAMRGAGFDIVLEDFDPFGRRILKQSSDEGWNYMNHRWMLVGAKLDGERARQERASTAFEELRKLDARRAKANRIADAEREVARLQGEIVQLQRALADIRASTSWRLTAPLRRLKGSSDA